MERPALGHPLSLPSQQQYPLGLPGTLWHCTRWAQDPSSAASLNGSTLEHQEFANGQPQERIHSNRHALSSPCCIFGWRLHPHELLEGMGFCSSPQSLNMSCNSLRHIVGKGRCILHHIEDYTRSFIYVTNCDE